MEAKFSASDTLFLNQLIELVKNRFEVMMLVLGGQD